MFIVIIYYVNFICHSNSILLLLLLVYTEYLLWTRKIEKWKMNFQCHRCSNRHHEVEWKCRWENHHLSRWDHSALV